LEQSTQPSTPSPNFIPPHRPQKNTPLIKNHSLVDIQAIAPHIRLDIRYATPHNFTKHQLYSQARCLLTRSTAERLSRVQANLEKLGLGLKVYDCYRPLSVQKQMWQIFPDSRYVADPSNGSRHNRGSAVDLTLVNHKGQALPMPSQFDDFTERAHLDYRGGTLVSRQNRQLLQDSMKQEGFIPLATEWWHFDNPNWQQHPIIDIPLEAVKNRG
jgi:D-alanyl-D-alanine dipeptidase